MASIVDRGTRAAPKFFARYDFIDGDGARRQRWKLLAGVQNRKQAARVEREVAAGRDPFPEHVASTPIKPLLDQWGKSLKNRNADDDRSRTKRQLVPRFGRLTLEQITLPVVMTWIDELGDSGLSPQTQRHALNTLSRFFSWCIERGLATINPVRMVPVGKRPTPTIDRDQPWLEDETKVPELAAALGHDLGLAFYLANRSGMRLGEVVGLRMGDLDFLPDGVIRVAHSYGGPLKEDRTGDLTFVVHLVPDEVGPKWSKNLGIEYAWKGGAIPDENTRDAIGEVIGFVTGRRLMPVGSTTFDAAGYPWARSVQSRQMSKCRIIKMPVLSAHSEHRSNSSRRRSP